MILESTTKDTAKLFLLCNAIGKINENAFDRHSPQTVLLANCMITPIPDGYCNVAVRCDIRDTGWNKIWNAETGEWEHLYRKGSAEPVAIHTLVDFDELLERFTERVVPGTPDTAFSPP